MKEGKHSVYWNTVPTSTTLPFWPKVASGRGSKQRRLKNCYPMGDLWNSLMTKSVNLQFSRQVLLNENKHPRDACLLTYQEIIQIDISTILPQAVQAGKHLQETTGFLIQDASTNRPHKGVTVGYSYMHINLYGQNYWPLRGQNFLHVSYTFLPCFLGNYPIGSSSNCQRNLTFWLRSSFR